MFDTISTQAQTLYFPSYTALPYLLISVGPSVPALHTPTTQSIALLSPSSHIGLQTPSVTGFTYNISLIWIHHVESCNCRATFKPYFPQVRHEFSLNNSSWLNQLKVWWRTGSIQPDNHWLSDSTLLSLRKLQLQSQTNTTFQRIWCRRLKHLTWLQLALQVERVVLSREGSGFTPG